MKAEVLFLCLLSACAAGRAAEVEFTVTPTAKKQGDKVTIAFTVSKPTDVEVAVMNAHGAVVRHLAAGVIGAGARHAGPLRKGLGQTLEWDGKDDLGKPAAGGPFRARVRLGLAARFDRVIGWSGQNIDAPRAMACGPDGTLYLLHGEKFYGHRRTALITAFGRDGKYRRQVYPGRGDLAPEQRPGWPWMKLGDQAEAPIVHHVLTRSVYPGAYFGGSELGNLAASGDGRLVVLSGCATTVGALIKYADVRGGRRLLILGADGSVPKNFLGPLVAGARVGGKGYVAVSPDGKYAYVSGLGAVSIWGVRKSAGIHQVVYRARLDGSDKAQVFIGTLHKPGSGKTGLDDPRGVAVDQDGNLYVADHGNGRIAVFTPAGRYLGEIPASGATRIMVSKKTGAVYAKIGTALVKFGGLKDPAKKAEHPLPTVNKDLKRHAFHLCLDDSGEEPALYLSCTRWLWSKLERVVDKGDRFVSQGDPIRSHRSKMEPGLPFVMNVVPVGDTVITRTPSFPAANTTSARYSISTGKYLGTWSPKGAGGGKEKRNALFFCGSEYTAGKDGRVYTQTGGFMWPAKGSANAGTLRRYDAAGRPVPFKTLGKHFVHKYYHGHHRPAGVFITRDGTIYAAVFPGYRGRDQKEKGLDVVVIAPDGTVKDVRRVFVNGTTVGGLAVDRQGNIIVGVQLWRKGRRIPPWLASKLPKSSRVGHPIRAYHQHGALAKFPPTGGRIDLDAGGTYLGHAGGYAKPRTGTPPHALRVENALWIRRIGYIPINDTREAGCQCENTRFDVDDYGRLFVPDLYRFRIAVLDGAGNEVTHFGAYGNMDNRGPSSKHPMPAIPLGWPIAARLAGDRVLVADLTNRRIVVARLGCTKVAACPLPK